MGSFKNYVVNGLTLSNAACGCVSILFAFEGNYLYAAYALVFAIIFDQFDGRVARFLKKTTVVGKELDSLADAVSFGVAPMILLYLVYLKGMGVAGVIVSVILALAAIYRLAKFNVTDVGDYFIGVPTPVSAGIALSLVIGNVELAPVDVALMAIVLSYLMVSNIPFYNFKNFGKLKMGEKNIIIIEIVVLIGGYLFYRDLVLIMVIFAYLVFVPIVRFFARDIK